MKEIKRDNAIIDYHVSGQADITLLFVHGAYIDQTYWKKQVAFFSNDYKVVTMDLPGHGQSGAQRKHWSVQGFAEDVITVIQELALSQVILIGHSLGAEVNLMVATLFPSPLIGFIAVDNFKNAATPLPAAYQQQVADIERKLVSDFRNTNEAYARMALLTATTPPAVSKKIVEAYRNANERMAIGTTPEMFTMYESEKRLLPQLQFKLYLINVDYMPTNEVPLKEYAGWGYKILHMKGTSHFPMIENPDELNRLLKELIQEIAIGVFHEEGS